MMEDRYGRADRIWVMDRGMISQENMEFLQQGRRRYILGTPKASLKPFERELLAEDWTAIREGLEVKRCESPTQDEVFILCRSRDRKEKEKAMHERFERRIEEGLNAITASCEKKKQDPITLARRVGSLLGKNSRSAGLFKVDIEQNQGRVKVVWSKQDAWRTWANLSEGCYLLRSNITGRTGRNQDGGHNLADPNGHGHPSTPGDLPGRPSSHPAAPLGPKIAVPIEN